MSYFRYVDNGEGPTKLFIGGVHGNEGKTSLKAYQQLKSKDDILNDLDILLKCGNPNELNNKITALNNEMSLLKKQITTLQDKLSSYQGKEPLPSHWLR